MLDASPLMITVQFVGSGDAFGSGGRLQAAISPGNASTHVLLDFGTSSLIGLARLGLAPTSRSATRVRCPRASGRRRRARPGRTRVCYALKTTPGRWYAAGPWLGALLGVPP